eukprot:1512952-Rhodomonas_salina.2
MISGSNIRRLWQRLQGDMRRLWSESTLSYPHFAQFTASRQAIARPRPYRIQSYPDRSHGIHWPLQL